MITCKEDLINTYVKNTPELRREFLSLAVKFGLIDSKSEICESSEEAVVAYWRDLTGDNPRVGCWFSYADQIKEECRELTLSDLKPKSKQFISKALEGSIKETVKEQFAGCIKRTPLSTECKWDLKSQGKEKPRTKLGYEKVTDSIFDLKDEFESGKLHYNFGDDEWFTYKDEASFATGFKEGNVYRKVERPVEWFDDAVEYLNQNRQSGSCDEQGVLSVGADMTRDQWCDFARILLEQEGE